MDPSVIAAGAGVVGGLAQYMNSEAARSASSKELDTIQGLYQKMQLPNFNPADITPEEYKIAGKYVPEVSKFVEEHAPTVVQQSKDMTTGRNAQLSALQRLRDISSNQGVDPQMAGLLNQASQRADIEAHGKNDAALQQANRQGLLGGGLQMAAQLQGNSDAMSRAANQGNEAASQAYTGRLQALRDSASLGGQIENQDSSMQARNAGIINAFNERNASRLQGQNNQGAATMNEANRYNTGVGQNVANMNTEQGNQFAQYNQRRQDQNAQTQYGNRMGIANAQAGTDRERIGQIQGAAQDRNAAIQGVTNIGTGVASGMASSNAQGAAQDRADRREQYKKTGSWDDEE